MDLDFPFCIFRLDSLEERLEPYTGFSWVYETPILYRDQAHIQPTQSPESSIRSRLY